MLSIEAVPKLTEFWNSLNNLLFTVPLLAVPVNTFLDRLRDFSLAPASTACRYLFFKKI
jgi:hypothetical protein